MRPRLDPEVFAAINRNAEESIKKMSPAYHKFVQAMDEYAKERHQELIAENGDVSPDTGALMSTMVTEMLKAVLAKLFSACMPGAEQTLAVTIMLHFSKLLAFVASAASKMPRGPDDEA